MDLGDDPGFERAGMAQPLAGFATDRALAARVRDDRFPLFGGTRREQLADLALQLLRAVWIRSDALAIHKKRSVLWIDADGGKHLGRVAIPSPEVDPSAVRTSQRTARYATRACRARTLGRAVNAHALVADGGEHRVVERHDDALSDVAPAPHIEREDDRRGGWPGSRRRSKGWAAACTPAAREARRRGCVGRCRWRL